MTFGQKLRELRNERQMTQPELAEAMGIEQSYLSKLENGKSLPSNDVLNRILDVFGCDIGGLVDDLDQGSRNQLRQIPDVASHFNRQREQLIGNRKRWLLSAALSLSIGIALVYAGQANLWFANIVYQYQSQGVVLEGEPKELFANPGAFVPGHFSPELRLKYVDAIRARYDEDFLQRTQYLGDVFNTRVDGGSRTYYLQNETEIDPWQNKFVVFIGVLLSVFGLVAISLEKKLSRFQ